MGVGERSGVRLLDAIDHEVPIPLLSQLGRSRTPHRRAKRGVVEQALDRARQFVSALTDAEAVDAVGDHLTERRDVTADDVAAAIQRLLDDPALRSTMGRAGSAKLAQKWDWDRVIDRVEEAYARALAHANADVGEALA